MKPSQYMAEEQQLVDQFWDEALVYLREYLQVLETPTGQCKDSAEATIQTYLSATQKKQTRCILKYRDMELVAKHLKAILAEPDKAKACFDPQKNYKEFALYTPSQEVRNLSAVSKWLDRPLLTDYYQKMGGPIGKAGLELNENFLAVTSRTDTTPHWKNDVSIKGLPTLWSSVGWIPFYAENPDAGGDRFRGGYLYGAPRKTGHEAGKMGKARCLRREPHNIFGLCPDPKGSSPPEITIPVVPGSHLGVRKRPHRMP